MEEFVKYAIAKGVKKYGFSSHAPLPFHTHWTMNAEDYPEYETEFYRLKDKYKDSIELFLGLEIDYIHGFSNAKSAFFQNIKLDYAIGSIHYLDMLADGSYWSIDGPFIDFDKGLTELFGGDIRLATERFYHISNCMIDLGGFDIVGHFDKITLHGAQYADFDTDTLWYRNLVGESLQQIKNKGFILEINTKSLSERGMTFPENKLFHLIHELQIPITVNSDCHYPSRVIDGFEITYSNLKKIGFTHLQQLVDGKWQAVSLQ
jgi:histidinol-phosphatase (PHP family)